MFKNLVTQFLWVPIPPNSSDDLCLPFCLILLLCILPSVLTGFSTREREHLSRAAITCSIERVTGFTSRPSTDGATWSKQRANRDPQHSSCSLVYPRHTVLSALLSVVKIRFSIQIWNVKKAIHTVDKLKLKLTSCDFLCSLTQHTFFY